MPRRPAVVTETDLVRVFRAARKVGACVVDVRPDGTVTVRLDKPPEPSTVEPEHFEI